MIDKTQLKLCNHEVNKSHFILLKGSYMSGMKKLIYVFILMSYSSCAFAQGSQSMVLDKADTAWMIVATALVMFMTPGLALFYGGMTRKKNVLSTITQSFVSLGVVSMVWILWAYSLAFAPDMCGLGLIGNLSFAGLKGVGFTPLAIAPTIPHQLFMLFQMMFAVITPAIITGAFAERFRFKTYLVFLVLWITFVYSPLAHWIWGGGWIAQKLKALDFAGGLVVHVSSGVAALVAVLLVGKRRGYGSIPMPPHNLIITILGAAMLWLGWYGFNGGSALSSGSLAVSAILTTHIASSAGAIAWLFIEWMHRAKPTALGFVSGALAGLVAITPASGYVTPLASVMIGFVGGLICYFFVSIIKPKLGYDDSLDAFGIHGIGGIWGAIATGLFASLAVNPAGANGLFYGNKELLIAQVASIAVATTYAFIVTWIILKVLDNTMGLRITDDEELQGLDLSQHGEKI